MHVGPSVVKGSIDPSYNVPKMDAFCKKFAKAPTGSSMRTIDGEDVLLEAVNMTDMSVTYFIDRIEPKMETCPLWHITNLAGRNTAPRALE